MGRKGKKYSAKEFVGVLKEYREDTETIVLSMDDREMETPVKEIALIRKYITFKSLQIYDRMIE